MQPVIERPALPAEVQSLVQQLQAVFQQYGFRINRTIPSDLSEEITVPAAYADDAAAAIGGVEIGHIYRTGSILKVRVT